MVDSAYNHHTSSGTGHPILRITAWTVLILIVALIVALFFVPTSWLSHIVSDQGSSRLGRSFTIEGPIRIHWDWTTPYVEAENIKLANIEGAPEHDMVDIDALKFHIKIWNLLRGQLNLPDIEIVQPKIVLEKFSADKKNWDFPALSKANVAAHAALPTKRSNFPIIGRLAIDQGKLTYRDQTVGLDTTLEVNTATGSSREMFHLAGNGALHDQKFTMNASGGSLEMLRESSQDYPLNVHIQMGKTEVKVEGTFRDPVNMEGVNAQVDIHGDNLADLFYITGAPLPPSPPYAFNTHLEKHGDVWTIDNLKGRLGESDLTADITYDTSGPRNYMKGAVVSHMLRMVDLGGFIGAKAGNETTTPSNKLLPNVPINLERLRAADVDVDFKATKINQPGWPIDNMDTHFHLKDGILKIEPLNFGVANGTISGPLTLNGQKDIPHVETNLILHSLSMKPFFSNTRFESLSQGRFGGRFQVAGDGKSLAEVLANSDGHVTLMMTGGTISKLIVDAAGLDIAKIAPELLDKDQKTDIRCAIGDFGDTNGLLKSNIFVFDTTASNIEGSANIDLKNETIDAKIQGHPKSVTISGQTPITITGALNSPDIGLSGKELAARGGAAAALSAVLTPLAAVLPFIDADLGKDSNCAALINAASSRSGVSPSQVAPQQPTPSQSP